MGLLNKLRQGLGKTKSNLSERIQNVLTLGRKIDESLYEELEEVLILGDVGVETSLALVEKLRSRAKEEKIKEADQLMGLLKEEIAVILASGGERGLQIEPNKLNIILVVGVNGAGKTTTIGKMSYNLKNSGYKVLLAAADTFRAAAIEQLGIWGERVGVDMIAQQAGSDPGAVVFDACSAAISRKADVLIVDTAGRLQNKANLMAELNKINKIIEREAPEANIQVLLVLDASTGQNAISQARLFSQAAPLSGLVLTKLDGTAKGGVIIGIINEMGLPVKLIGVGEGIDDLKDFVPEDFVQVLFEEANI